MLYRPLPEPTPYLLGDKGYDAAALRRVATRYDKLAANFLSGVALATALAFWL